MDLIYVVLLIVSIVVSAISVILLITKFSSFEQSTREGLANDLKDIPNEIRQSKNETNQNISNAFSSYGKLINAYQENAAKMQSQRMAELAESLSKEVSNLSNIIDKSVKDLNLTVDKKVGDLNATVDKQLTQVRDTVDEKLEKTLNDRITRSFEMVNKRLEEVHKGLGEMQTLAQGVGDIKKVLSNVKARGILGEVQLRAILVEILAVGQYEENVATKPNSGERVEFAVKMPGEGGTPVLLPIDSKFPGDAYARLVDAYENGDKAEIATATKNLERVLKSEAKDISEKYVSPPFTTDFAVMFLPFEGLYAEAVRMGMVEVLQREYKVNIAGPTTMAALLNSLQMGFRTLAIQKRSSEVWEVLGAVKTEFGKFADVLEKTRSKLRLADSELEKLIGTRTNVINRKLKSVTEVSYEASALLLGDEVSFDEGVSEDEEEV